MLAKAVELAEAHGWFLCRQFENEANAEVHARTTAQEILADFEGERLDYWVTGAGTGGTLKGVGRVLRERRPETRIILCEPDNSPMLSSGVAQPRHADGSPSESHALFRPHVVQGWTPDFIPKLTEDALAAKYVDRVVAIDGNEAMRLARELAQKEGIFVGTSAGATFAGALQVCATAEPGSTVLCMLPDTGERYLSTPLFDGISTGMTEEEVEIAMSTPGYRFEAPAAPALQAAQVEPPAEEKEYVRRILADPELPVVMFAFEYCEFCWSVRKLFSRAKIAYRSVDLDSVELQAGDRGGKIRAAVSHLTGSPTIPQIFVGGEFVGGATEVFDAFLDGSLQRRLSAHGVAFDTAADFDPYSLLPGWLEQRRGAVCAVPERDAK
jgi:cysteine synthase A